jgi:hypothetical protein
VPVTRWTRQRLDHGVLDAEQHLEWDAPWPDVDERLAGLSQLLEREHLRSIERFSLRLLRCRREGARLTCRLATGTLALSFTDEATEVSPERVVRRWTIDPSFLARRVLAGQGSSATYGHLEIGLARVPTAAGQAVPPEGRVHGWVSVTAFPSRFLTPLPRRVRRLGLFRRPVGRAYALFHARASFSCLYRVARAMQGDTP